jgi:alkaline phosphatase isozyme conversion protein
MRGNGIDLGILKIMTAFRKLSIISMLWLATGLLMLPACAWLSGAHTIANPVTTSPIVSPNPAQTTSLPTASPLPATLQATTMKFPTASLAPVLTGSAEPVYGQTAIKHIEALSEAIGPRPAGTTKESKAAEYIETALKELGYQTSRQPFTFPGADGSREQSANVIGVKPGQSAQEIIIGAHYDSVSAGEGADDNASGVGVMLEVAELVKDRQTPYTIRFVVFGAEEAGLYGSGYYVKQMSAADIQNTISMINLDSLVAGDTANVYGSSSPADTIRNWFLQYAQSQALDLQTQPVENLDYPNGSPCDCSDYSAFQAAGIPFAYFEATDWTLGNRDGWTQVDPKFGKQGEIWNTQYDYLEYINQNFPGRVEQHLNLFVRLLFGALTEYK